MAKYLRKFETSAAYDAAKSTLDKPNVSYIVETNGVAFNPYIIPPRMDIITYEAPAKLAETTQEWASGLRRNAFSGTSGQLTMTSHAFENGVGTIEFDGDVTIIGRNAFKGCNITNIAIPDSVTSIGSAAFYKCTSLTSVTIPDSVTSIVDSAFSGCTGLTSITIPDSVTSIGQSAFYKCTSLTSVTIPNGVTSINGQVFQLCSGLTSITIPSGVTSIGNSAFSGCRGLTSVTIGSSVTDIGQWAFASCTSLTSISIPSSVTSIIGNAFEECTGLTSIVVDSANTVYDSRDNCNAIIKTSTNELIIGCKNTIIPNTITSIGKSAFKACSGLTSITIPNSVTGIGNTTFNGCSGLTSIICNATTAPTINSYTFENVKTGGTLTVPSGSTGYDVWMGTGNYYLGKYNWTKVEQ